MARVFSLLPLVLSAILVALLSRPPPADAGRGEALILPRKEVIQVLAAPMRPLAVDFFWIQMLVRITTAASAADGLDIYRYAKLISDLEPTFRPVYLFGGVMTVWENPDGTHANSAESTEILRRGVEQFPDHITLYVLLAYNLMTFEKDNIAAADVLSKAARLNKHAPAWIGELAVKLYRKENAEDAAATLLGEMAAQEERDGNAMLKRRLGCSAREEIVNQLNRAIDSYYRAHQRNPASVEELVAEGHLRAPPPADAFGGRWVIGHGGRAEVEESEESCR